MKKITSIFSIFILVFWFTTSCSSDNNIPEPDIVLEAEVLLNVSYGSHPRQVYDLYLPEGRTQENTKVIVLVHGGGWTAGDKSEMNDIVVFFRANHPDYALANINYVLAETGVPAFPNQFLDLGSVISQLTEQQNEFQIQPQFGLVGTSAGANISMMYAYAYDNSNQVKFVTNIVGPTDFTDPFYADNPDFNLVFPFLIDENAYPSGTNLFEAVSPVYQVSSTSSPTIIFYGNQDPLVPLSNGETLEATLNAAGVTNSLNVYEGGHGNDWSEADFLDLRLKLEAFMLFHLPL
jgi:acetyl esterase/lipase